MAHRVICFHGHGPLASLACGLLLACASPVKKGASTDDTGLEIDAVADVAAQDAPDEGVGVDTGQSRSADAGGACAGDEDCPPSGDPCAPNRCNLSGRCAIVAIDGGLCDDGNPCTAPDLCKAGVCSPGPNTCRCQISADCKPQDDANLCNGTLYCDKSAIPYTCAPDPGTVVVCDKGADTQCAQAACSPETGKCALVPRIDGVLCNDGDACTVESACKDGACVAGKASWCECQSGSDCAPLEDADLCNGTLYCDTFKFPYRCRVNPATVVQCSTHNDTACLKNRCKKKEGKCAQSPEADGSPCDDGDGTTLEDTCQGGVCTAGVSTAACKSNADCKDDGDLCNGVPYCDKAASTCKPNPATVIYCKSGADTPCKKNTCAPATGDCVMQNVKNGTACDDNDACSAGELCLQGTCGGGKNVCLCSKDADCEGKDDGNACNGVPFCNKATGGCELDPTSAVVCPTPGESACVKNACVPMSGKCTPTAVEEAKLLPCPSTSKDGEPKPACRWEVRSKGEPAGEKPACDDGDGCTEGELCGGGACGGGTFVCSCQSDQDCVAEDDGNLCNGLMFCNKAKKPAVCAPNPASSVHCPSVKDTGCLKNTCQPTTGKCLLTPTQAGTACSDGSDCTQNDYCLGGKCEAGTKVCACEVNADCDAKEDGDACNGTLYCDKSGDKPACKLNPASVVTCPGLIGQPCRKNVCNKANGQCQPVAAHTGKGCDDGDACTGKDACIGGGCAGSKRDCNDGNPCTNDTCAPKTGCVHNKALCNDGNDCTTDLCDEETGKCTFPSAKLHGKVCNADNDGCTVNDRCSAGVCKPGPTITCTVPLKQCEEAACISTSVFNFHCLAVPVGDGLGCSDGAVCKLGARCEAGTCRAGSDDKLFSRVVRAASGHLRLADVREVSSGGKSAGFVAVGTVWQGKSDAPTSLAWAVTRVDVAGHRLWVTTIPAPRPDLAAVARGMAFLDDGSTLVVGAVRAQKNVGMDAQVVAVSASGKTVTLKKTYGAAGTGGIVDDVLEAVVAQSESAWLAAGWTRDGDGKRRAWLLRLSDLGKRLGSWTWPGLYQARAAAMVGDLGGGAVLVGDTHAKKARRQGWLMRVDAQGKAVWTRHYDHAEADGQVLVALDRDPDGLLLAGWRIEGAARRSLLLKVASDGEMRWERVSAGDDVALAVATLGTAKQVASYLVAGRVGKSADLADLWLRGVDAHRYVLFDRSVDLGTDERLVALRPTIDGGLVGVGRTSDAQGRINGVLLRITPWAQTSCQAAGKCAALGAANCDDGNACTDDFCTSKQGCIHSNNVNACNDGNACTIADRCKSGACTVTKARSCDDGNVCTTDGCGPKTGCSHKPGAGPCDDGSKCTTGDKCVGGACKAQVKVCDDGDFCTLNGCSDQTGCTYDKSDAACDDANACTKDICRDGSKKDKAGACAHDAKSADGQVCEDGDRCTIAERCAGGTCGGGRERLFVKAYGNDTTQIFRGVAELDDGSFVLGGVNNEYNGSGGFVARVSASGEQLMFKFVATDCGASAWTWWGAYNDVAAVKDKSGIGFVTVGSCAASKTEALGQLRRFTLDGVALNNRVYTVSPKRLWLRRVKAVAGGTLVWTGAREHEKTGSDKWSMELARTDTFGNLIWQRGWGGAKGEGGNDLVERADRTLVVAGYSANLGSGSTDGVLTAVTSAGHLVWRRAYGGGKADGFNALLALPDGGLVAVGSTASKGAGVGPAGWILRVDAAGGPIDEHVQSRGQQFWWRSILHGPAGGWIGVGEERASAKSGNSRIVVEHLDADGKATWTRVYGGADRDRAHRSIVTHDGDLVHAGSTGIYRVMSWDDALLMRTDARGHLGCKVAGKCAQVAPSGCDDGDVCTDDLCEPAKGCVHDDNKAGCDDGNPCTVAASCKDGSCRTGTARYYDVTIGGTSDELGVDLLLAADGTMFALGRTPTLSKGATFAQVAVGGSIPWTGGYDPVPGGGEGFLPSNAAPLQDGGWLLCGQFVSPNSKQRTDQVVRLSPQGQTEKVHSGVPGRGPAWCAPQPDGSVVLLSNANDTDGSGKPVHTMAANRFIPATGAFPLLASSGLPSLVPRAVATSTSGGIGVVGQQGADRQIVELRYDVASEKLTRIWSATAACGLDCLLDAVAPPDGAGVVAAGIDKSGPAGSADGWIAIAGDGAVKRQRSYGGGGAEAFSAIARRPRGGYLAAGSTSSSGAGGQDGWLVAVDADLSVLWTRTYGGAKADALSDIALTADGAMALLGTTASKGAGGSDMWLIRADPWGRFSCAAIGTCIDEDALTCDDLDPCTTDACDKDKGCVHTPAALACGESPSCPKTDGWKDPPPQQRAQFDLLFGKASASDGAVAVLDLGDGRVQAAGHRWQQVATLSDGWMVQTTASGRVVWERGWGGDKNDRFEAMVRHPAGGVVAAGHTASAIFGNAGGEDGWLVRVSDTGTQLWTRTYGGKEDDALWGLTVDSSGHIAAVGRSKSKSAGDFDGWLLRTDAVGAPTWQRTFGGTGIDYLFDVVTIPTADGSDILAIGHIQSPGGEQKYPHKGGFDLWLLRFNAAGGLLWDRNFGTPKDDFGRALLRTPDGGFVVAGGSLGFGFGDAMLWRFDKEGDLAWQRNFGGKNLFDSAVALAKMPGGGFALAGLTASKGAGKQDGWIVVAGEDGALVWDRTIGTAVDERLGAIAPLRHGGFALAGVRDKPDAQAWVLRTNGWGFADCKKAGQCAHLGPELCDDGVACTADACDVTKGCTHTLIPGAGDCPPLNTKDKAGTSCAAIKKADPGAASGRYFVDPGGAWKKGAVLVGCDMVTDGGGWTLLAALRKDAPMGFHLSKQTGAGPGAVALAAQLQGDVGTTAWLEAGLAQQLGGAGRRELLIDIGAGLFRLRYDTSSQKQIAAGAAKLLAALRPTANSAVTYDQIVFAPGAHAPAATVVWQPTSNKLPVTEACKKSSDACPYLPADIAGAHQHIHRHGGEPGAGYDGKVPHFSRVFVR